MTISSHGYTAVFFFFLFFVVLSFFVSFFISVFVFYGGSGKGKDLVHWRLITLNDIYIRKNISSKTLEIDSVCVQIFVWICFLPLWCVYLGVVFLGHIIQHLTFWGIPKLFSTVAKACLPLEEDTQSSNFDAPPWFNWRTSRNWILFYKYTQSKCLRRPSGSELVLTRLRSGPVPSWLVSWVEWTEWKIVSAATSSTS